MGGDHREPQALTSSGLGRAPQVSAPGFPTCLLRRAAPAPRDLGGSARNLLSGSPSTEVLRLHPPSAGRETSGREMRQTQPLGWGVGRGFSRELSPPLSWVSESVKVAEGLWGLFGWGTAFLKHLQRITWFRSTDGFICGQNANFILPISLGEQIQTCALTSPEFTAVRRDVGSLHKRCRFLQVVGPPPGPRAVFASGREAGSIRACLSL